MAYLEHDTLTCPGCGATGPVAWVIGVGPNTKPGEGPAYVSATPSDTWRVEPAGRNVRLHCKAYGAMAGEKKCPDR